MILLVSATTNLLNDVFRHFRSLDNAHWDDAMAQKVENDQILFCKCNKTALFVLCVFVAFFAPKQFLIYACFEFFFIPQSKRFSEFDPATN